MMPRILSLDTETEILGLLHAIFERAGYEHIYTTDNEEALSILRSQKVDLFTQNIMRPKMSGCELYQLMRSEERLHDIPVLVITTLSPMILSRDCQDMIRDLYPHNYMMMPFSPQDLLAVIRRILAETPRNVC